MPRSLDMGVPSRPHSRPQRRHVPCWSLKTRVRTTWQRYPRQGSRRSRRRLEATACIAAAARRSRPQRTTRPLGRPSCWPSSAPDACELEHGIECSASNDEHEHRFEDARLTDSHVSAPPPTSRADHNAPNLAVSRCVKTFRRSNCPEYFLRRRSASRPASRVVAAVVRSMRSTRCSDPHDDAVDGEWGESVGLEEAHQEADRDIGGGCCEDGRDEGLSADVVSG